MLRQSPERLLIAGHQDELIDFDLTTFTETATVISSVCNFFCSIHNFISDVYG